MSVAGYQSYRDSGVEWLGKVPAHWTLTRAKYACRYTTGWTPPTGKDEYYGEEFPWANISDLGPREVSHTSKGITQKAVDDAGAQLSPKGSLLFSFKLSVGQVSFAGRDLYTNEAIATFLPGSLCDPKYGYYALPLFLLKNAAENIYGAKLLNQQLIGGAMLCLPPAVEQDAITAFLDRETGKIDALVKAQRQLIELLKEKRQTVISSAVTKGLDRSVPMKDSSIDWVGDIPSGWSCVPIMSVAEVVDPNPSHRNPEYVDEGYPFISTQEFLPNGEIELNTPRRVSEITVLEQEKRCRFLAGSIAFSRKGTIGEARLLPHGVRMGLLDSLCVINPKEGIDPRFLLISLKASYVVSQYSLFTRGAALPQMSVGRVRSLKIVLPPLSEQVKIVSIIDQHDAANVALTREAEAAIALLQERRTVLISAAVTGKIDVRGLVHDQVAA